MIGLFVCSDQSQTVQNQLLRVMRHVESGQSYPV
jgi:hypothetical protein